MSIWYLSYKKNTLVTIFKGFYVVYVSFACVSYHVSFAEKTENKITIDIKLKV